MGNSEFSRLSVLAKYRMSLMLRQRLGWFALGAGLLLILLSSLVANVSFINFTKMYFDFSLASMFVLSLSLAAYLGSQLFSDEQQRRTLHLVLSHGVSRTSWFVGNYLGLTAFFWLALSVWTLAIIAWGKLSYEGLPDLWLVTQSMFALGLELLVVLALAMLFSLMVRSILAFFATTSLVIFLHSLDSLRRIFLDPESGRFIESKGVSAIIWLAKLLPPLHWFDLKDLVGYEAAFPTFFILKLVLLAFLWVLCLLCFSIFRIKRMDL